VSRDVRLWTSAAGYRYISVEHPDDGSVDVISEHRLAAVAWGVLETLGDSQEVHHSDRCKANTAESNLVACSREDHIERHVDEALRRGETPPVWVVNALPFAVRNDLVDGDGELREAEGRT